MPRLSKWALALALAYLVSGAVAGAALMVYRAAGDPSLPAWLLPLHVEFMVAGWTVQLAMGVAYWILPRHRTEPVRGNRPLAWGAFAIFNVGVLFAAVGGGKGYWPGATLGHGAEAVGVLLFATGIWQRLPRSISSTGRSLPIIG